MSNSWVCGQPTFERSHRSIKNGHQPELQNRSWKTMPSIILTLSQRVSSKSLLCVERNCSTSTREGIEWKRAEIRDNGTCGEHRDRNRGWHVIYRVSRDFLTESAVYEFQKENVQTKNETVIIKHSNNIPKLEEMLEKVDYFQTLIKALLSPAHLTFCFRVSFPSGLTLWSIILVHPIES